MIELSQHIEVLLLENDCVIVPGLGGFVAHYTPAIQVEENMFLPPTRTIGFNPQLKLNDGLLVQSYMAVYDTNFSDASKIVEDEVSELIIMLHKEGKVDLDNVGEIRYTIHDTYEFIPYDNKITTPYLYGLDSFEMKELTVLHQEKEKVLVPVIQERKKSYEIKINRGMVRSAVAIVAAVVLFFFLSTPVENTYVEKDNYAQLLPIDLFEKIEGKSIAMTPVVMNKDVKQSVKAVSGTSKKTGKKVTKPVAVREVKVTQPVTEEVHKTSAAVQSNESQSVPSSKAVVKSKQTEGNFHIIVAGGIGVKDAEVMAERLKAEGFTRAKVLNNDGKIRVSIMSCTTREEGTKQLLKLRENDTYKTAWLLVK
ncbi:HU domain-containing protein [Bacteroides nordii]|uniref:HU domain-containing protein n=1 Tax=Bacteroides nordii TaxID=291645 RepID=UPI00203FE18E|nr:SPOR domain-containing protein [Bacteroides nordii]GFZ41967.1 cell division protein [Bacteroides nordii]